jgi:hypothetical protein
MGANLQDTSMQTHFRPAQLIEPDNFLLLTWIGWPCGDLPRHAFRGFAGLRPRSSSPRFIISMAAVRFTRRRSPMVAINLVSLSSHDGFARRYSSSICLLRIALRSTFSCLAFSIYGLRLAAANSSSHTRIRFRWRRYSLASSRERHWFLNRSMKRSPKPGLTRSQISFICASTLAALASAFAASLATSLRNALHYTSV